MKMKQTQPIRGLFKNFAGKMRAFTMAEVLIALTLIGVLVMILFPVLSRSKPDELEALHKKGQYIMEQIVSDLISDEDIYPNTITTRGLASIGEAILDGKKYGDPDKNKNTDKAKSKFCELFASRLNLAPGSTIKCRENSKTTTSVEGIDWYLPISNFDGSDGSNYGIIKFDVNGKKGPNCKYDKSQCPRPDTFIYYIQPDGKIIQETPDPSLLRYNILINVEQGSAIATCNGGSCYGLKPGSYEVQLHPTFGHACKPWLKKSVYLTNADYVDKVDCSKAVEDDPSVEKGTIHIVKTGEVSEDMSVADGIVFLNERVINFTNCTTTGTLRTCEAFVDGKVGVNYSLNASANRDNQVASSGIKTATISSQGQTAEMSIRFNWDYNLFKRYKFIVKVVNTDPGKCTGVLGGMTRYYCGKGGTYVPLPSSGIVSNVPDGSGCSVMGIGLAAQDLSGSYECKIQYSSGSNSVRINGADATIIATVYPSDSPDIAPDQETFDVNVNIVCSDGSKSCGGVTGNGQYVKGSSATVNVTAASGYKIVETGKTEWSTTVNNNFEKTITIAADTYCINVAKNGNGKIIGPDGNEVTSGQFCSVPGTYNFTAVPDAGYKSDWTKDNLKVVLKDKDVNISCTFTKEEEKTYCLNVQMLEENKSPCASGKCGTAKLVGETITDVKEFSPIVSEQCGLRNGSYDLTVTPSSGYGINPKLYKITIDNSSSNLNLRFYKPITIKFLVENSSYGKIIDGDNRVTSLNYPVQRLTAVDLPQVESASSYEFLKWRCNDEIDFAAGEKGAFEREVTCRAVFSKDNRTIKIAHANNFELVTTSYTLSYSHQLVGVNKLFLAIENYSNDDYFAIPVNISWDVKNPNSYDTYWRLYVTNSSGNSVSSGELCLVSSFSPTYCYPSSNTFPTRAGNTSKATSGSQDYYFRFKGGSYSSKGLYLYVCYQYLPGTSTSTGYTISKLVETPSLSDNRQCSAYFISPSM